MTIADAKVRPPTHCTWWLELCTAHIFPTPFFYTVSS